FSLLLPKPFKFSPSSADTGVVLVLNRASGSPEFHCPVWPRHLFRCPVPRLKIHCASCGQTWSLKIAFTVYEQQAVESSPCPRCGASTLCCPDPKDRQPLELAAHARRRRAAM